MPIKKHKFSTGEFKIYFDEIEGLCSDPDAIWRKDDEKHIVINPRLKKGKRRRLEVIIHESLHAEYPSLPKNNEEVWVNAAAINISKLLWKLGYRVR